MNKTTNYQLNQWERTDKVQMEDFNADNAKIDAALASASFGNCRIAVGSYIGTGEIGEDHPNTLTFNFYPKIIFLDSQHNYTNSTSTNYMIMLLGLEKVGFINQECNVVWNGKTVSWYNPDTWDKPDTQFNTLNRVYHYIALGTAEE